MRAAWSGVRKKRREGDIKSRSEIRKEKENWSRSGERKEKRRSEVRKEKGNWSRSGERKKIESNKDWPGATLLKS